MSVFRLNTSPPLLALRWYEYLDDQKVLNYDDMEGIPDWQHAIKFSLEERDPYPERLIEDLRDWEIRPPPNYIPYVVIHAVINNPWRNHHDPMPAQEIGKFRVSKFILGLHNVVDAPPRVVRLAVESVMEPPGLWYPYPYGITPDPQEDFEDSYRYGLYYIENHETEGDPQ